MLKRLAVALLVIIMITFQLPQPLTRALGATSDGSLVKTTGSTTLKAAAQLNLPALTEWVLDEPTNTLYAVSQSNKALYFINAATMTVEKSLTFTGGPTDIIKDSGKLYIPLNDVHQIAIVDMATREITSRLFTSSDPYRIVKDGNRLYYVERDQHCKVYSYDLTTKLQQVLPIGTLYQPDIAINPSKRILYIGESGSSGSSMIYYSLTENKIIGETNYDGGYGFPYPQRYTLFDGLSVYYAGRNFNPDNPHRYIGNLGGNIIFAKNKFIFTNTSVFDAVTNEKLGDLGSNADLVEASGTAIYFYNKSTGIAKAFDNSGSPIDKTNIISVIQGVATAPIQSYARSVQLDPKTYSLGVNSNLTEWVLDEETNTLYAISKEDKALFFVNATTLNLEESMTFTSSPTDIIIEKGKLYIALNDINQIIVVDAANRTFFRRLYTTSDPYRIVIDGNKLYYTELDQWCDIYAYDLIANTDQKLSVGSVYQPDIAINTDSHILYIGESGLSGSDMIYYSTTLNKVIGTTTYDGGYGFPYPQRHTIFDGELVYYASRDFDPENPAYMLGSYGANIIFAKYGLAFSRTGIYDSYTNEYLGGFVTQLDLAEFSNRADFYLYNKQGKAIIKIEPEEVPPVIKSVSPNTGSVKGGTVVNIAGTGFTGVTEVYFDDTPGTDLKVNSDTSITVTSPSVSNIGTVDIILVGPNVTNLPGRSGRFTYTGLTVSATATNGRITGLLPDYNVGETVTLTASPSAGYTFKNWTDKSGNILSTNRTYSFTITDNVELIANFSDNCDVNKDGKIDILDLALVANNYNVKSSDANWIPIQDFNMDEIIDILDLVISSKKLIN
jgi:uncharacterized repeat protein (TIGR02543 family)